MKKNWIIMMTVSAALLCSCAANNDAAVNIEADQMVAEMVIDVTKQTMISSAASTDSVDTEETATVIEEDGKTATEVAHGRTMTESQLRKESIHYFTLVQNSTSYSGETNAELLVETLTVPDFYSADPELCDWINGIIDELYNADLSYSQKLVAFAQTDLEQLGEDSFYSYSHHVSMGVGRHDNNVISLLSLSSVYSGGTHPNSVLTAHNLDLVAQRALKLEDVIYAESANKLNELVLDSVQEKFSSLGENVLFEDYTQVITTALDYGNMTPHWYFSNEGLVIFFNQYSLGSYASGIIRTQILYEQLTDILRQEFYPERINGVVTDVYIEEQPSEGEWVYYADFSEGETAYISIDGKATHVQLSEVFWADQTPVGESMLFSANQIDDSTTIAVTGDLMSDTRVYALEYCDENGGPYTVYVQGMKVIDELPADE